MENRTQIECGFFIPKTEGMDENREKKGGRTQSRRVQSAQGLATGRCRVREAQTKYSRVRLR